MKPNISSIFVGHQTPEYTTTSRHDYQNPTNHASSNYHHPQNNAGAYHGTYPQRPRDTSRQPVLLTPTLFSRISSSKEHIVPFYISQTRNLVNRFGKYDYARLPYIPGTEKDQPLWLTVVNSASKLSQIASQYSSQSRLSSAMEACVKAYCPDVTTNFSNMDSPDLQKNMRETIPNIVDLALKLPQILEQQIPILKQGSEQTIYLSRILCASLLANAFLCTFPSQAANPNLPSINFSTLYNDSGSDRGTVKVEKLKCLLRYFKTLHTMQDLHDQVISFQRKGLQPSFRFTDHNAKLCKVASSADGKIEYVGEALQVDFANKRIGGGVLNNGCVMEEIRFCISPELIISRLFTEDLLDNEVLIVKGTDMFSSHSGYGSTFKYQAITGDVSSNRVDDMNRGLTEVVAMDALHFKENERYTQYQATPILRELYKCYAAFSNPNPNVATGNWGCGAFNGDPELKFVIQWISASHARKYLMHYFTAGDKKFAQEITDFCDVFMAYNISAGRLTQMLSEYRYTERKQPGSGIFSFLRKRLGPLPSAQTTFQRPQ